MSLFVPGIRNLVAFSFLSDAKPRKKPVPPPCPKKPRGDSYLPPRKKPPADRSTKGPPPKPLVPFRAEYEGKILKKVTIKPTSTPKEKREDDAGTLKAGINDAIRPAFEKISEKHKKFFVRLVFTISYDSNGNVIQVSCEELEFKNAPSEDDNIRFLVEAANALRSQFRFKKIDDNGFNFFKAPIYMGVIGSSPP